MLSGLSVDFNRAFDLFIIELNVLLHGKNEIFRFHSGTNQLNGSIVWQGDQYDKFPIQAEGFEYSGTGSLPRPTLTVSNVFGFVTSLIIDTNKVTAKNDLQGAKFTRRRVLASSLDDVNFTDGSNDAGTDADKKYDEVYTKFDRTLDNLTEKINEFKIENL